MSPSTLDEREINRLRAVAAVLIPGDGDAPAALDLDDIDDLLQRAAAAIAAELPVLREGVRRLPENIGMAALAAFCEHDPEHFSLIGTAVSGAYFMSPAALAALGYPTGPRSAPPFDMAADELAGGILQPVIDRGFDD